MLLLKFKSKFFLVFLLLFIGNGVVHAQSDEKEGSNNFAMYTKSGDFKLLENARKFSDNAYKDHRDSITYRNNLLRALVYSSLAVADSNRKLKYTKDPIEEARFALSKLNDDQLNYENQAQIIHIQRKLSNAYLILGKRALNNNKLEEAYNHFLEVDAFSESGINVKHNLSVLSSRLDKPQEAVEYYEDYLESLNKLTPANVLILAELYSQAGNPTEQLNTLVDGLDIFPNDKDILFQTINIYADNGSYDAVVPLIDVAIKLDPENIKLNYLAGYAYEITGNRKLAAQYYETVIKLDDNNYNGNYELGLLFLRDYINNTSNVENFNQAEKYLLKANEIDPNSINALKSLAVLYEKSADTIQYERVKNQLNQNTFNN
jgi:tetratricopeptide (TPR) repeat protein